MLTNQHIELLAINAHQRTCCIYNGTYRSKPVSDHDKRAIMADVRRVIGTRDDSGQWLYSKWSQRRAKFGEPEPRWELADNDTRKAFRIFAQFCQFYSHVIEEGLKTGKPFKLSGGSWFYEWPHVGVSRFEGLQLDATGTQVMPLSKLPMASLVAAREEPAPASQPAGYAIVETGHVVVGNIWTMGSLVVFQKAGLYVHAEALSDQDLADLQKKLPKQLAVSLPWRWAVRDERVRRGTVEPPRTFNQLVNQYQSDKKGVTPVAAPVKIRGGFTPHETSVYRYYVDGCAESVHVVNMTTEELRALSLLPLPMPHHRAVCREIDQRRATQRRVEEQKGVTPVISTADAKAKVEARLGRRQEHLTLDNGADLDERVEKTARAVYQVVCTHDWQCTKSPHMELKFDDASIEMRRFMRTCARLALGQAEILNGLKDTFCKGTFEIELRRYALSCGWKPGSVTDPVKMETPFAGTFGEFQLKDEDSARFWVMYWAFLGAAAVYTA